MSSELHTKKETPARNEERKSDNQSSEFRVQPGSLLLLGFLSQLVQQAPQSAHSLHLLTQVLQESANIAMNTINSCNIAMNIINICNIALNTVSVCNIALNTISVCNIRLQHRLAYHHRLQHRLKYSQRLQQRHENCQRLQLRQRHSHQWLQSHQREMEVCEIIDDNYINSVCNFVTYTLVNASLSLSSPV